ncbi:MAG: apolipoprotein N-acyltransferase, partial [Chitinophagaceae bacterium]|nr:apolipoprotein N-acyltransferase [Chitinophagaceae bacterium]
MQRISFLGLSVLSGLLLFFAWNPLSFTFCIFFAWVPLLFLADKIQHKKSFIGYAFLALIIWNACTTWWIWNSTDIGSVFAIAFNSTIMLMPWYGFFITKKKQGNFVGYFALIAFWLLFEFIHLNWELSFPWLTLGNAFADKVNWVQWYEFTGVAGGSLWVLLVNIVAYELFKNWKSKNSKWSIKVIVVIVCIISVPFAISNFLLYRISKEQNFDSNVVIVQPNIDPYQKFTYNTIAKQIEKLIALSENKIDSQTKWVIWP